MEQNYAPVVIFAYKREEHFRQVIEALSKCNLAKNTEVFIYIDGPKKEADTDAVQAVRSYAETIKDKQLFQDIYVEASIQNKGLSASIIGGVDKIINQYGKVIVLEDDIVVKKEFLEFMNGALNYYEQKKNIWAISAYTMPLQCLKNLDDFIYANYRANCWGWASWADRWNGIDWQVMDYKQFVFNRKQRKGFNRGGNDLSRMLDAYMMGDIDSWAVRWNYAQFKKKMLAIAPKVSLCTNTGFDGSGENCGVKQQKKEKEMQMSIGSFHEVTVKPQILEEFKKHYDTLYPVKLRVKKQMLSIWRRVRWSIGIRRRRRGTEE